MLAFAHSAAAADPYPTRPVTIVVPNGPSGPTDKLARSLGQKLALRLGQSVIIDNRGGAGGTIGAESVARARNDGYTFLLATTGTQAIAPALYDKLRYDTEKDFEPVAFLTSTANVVVVRSSLGIKDVHELVALAKREPDRLSYGSSGNGSSNHLAAEMFKSITGTEIKHVPYKAISPLRMDLWEGRIDLVFASEVTALNDFIQPGKGRALMVSGDTRSALFPNAPSAKEAGMKSYDLSAWWGLMAPAGTPAPIVERMNKELVAILASPEMKKEMVADGQATKAMTPRQFAAFLAQERAKYVPIVKATNAKIN